MGKINRSDIEHCSHMIDVWSNREQYYKECLSAEPWNLEYECEYNKAKKLASYWNEKFIKLNNW